MICSKECEASPDALPAPCGSATVLDSMLLQSPDRPLFVSQRDFDQTINGVEVRALPATDQIRLLQRERCKSAKRRRNSLL